MKKMAVFKNATGVQSSFHLRSLPAPNESNHVILAINWLEESISQQSETIHIDQDISRFSQAREPPY